MFHGYNDDLGTLDDVIALRALLGLPNRIGISLIGYVSSIGASLVELDRHQ
jgi:hypothetical protein